MNEKELNFQFKVKVNWGLLFILNGLWAVFNHEAAKKAIIVIPYVKN